MTLTFASPTVLNAEFHNIILGGAIFVAILVVAFELSYRDSPAAMKFKTRIVIGLLGVICIVWYAYSSTYEQFVSADISHQEIQLQFAGPFSREIIISRSEVTAVRIGLPDRGSSRCSVDIEAGSSGHYHSAWIPDQSSICKRMRDDILRELGM